MINSMAKHKYVLYMTLIAMLWDIVSGYLLYLCYPEHYLTFYPVIPIYFYLLNMGCYLLVDSFKDKSRSHVMVFLASKMIKMLVSIVLLLIYIVFVKVQRVEFLIAFLGNYLFFLIIDTILMSAYKPHKAALVEGGINNEAMAE